MSLVERSVPIFPLPQVQLFPHALLPLHVFEPRYRELLRDCLQGDKVMALAQLAPGYEARYYERPDLLPICGVGEVVAHEPLPDGRSNILLCGLYRARIVEELPPEHAYRTVRLAPLADACADPARAESLLATVRLLVGQLATRAPAAARLGEMLVEHHALGPITDVLAAALVTEPAARQRLLETADVLARGELIASHLAAALTRLADHDGPAN